jgi:hypothetical protein
MTAATRDGTAISGRGSKFSGHPIVAVPARRGDRAYDCAAEYEFPRARHYVPIQFIVTDDDADV